MNRYAKTLSAILILAAASVANAQQNGGGPGGGGPGGGMGGDGGPPDPQQMREMMDARIKTALAVSDDAWANLQPMIDKVEQLAHESDTGPMMHGHPPHGGGDQDNNGGPGGQGGPGGPGGGDQGPGGDDDHPHSEIESAISSLKKVLADKSSSDGKIEDAMKAVQDVEKKAKEDLADARKALKGAVNLRQQAVLVALGVLN